MMMHCIQYGVLERLPEIPSPMCNENVFWRRHIPKQIGFISNNIAMIVAFDYVHCGALVELRRIIPICCYHLMNIIQPIVKPWLTMGIGYVVKGF